MSISRQDIEHIAKLARIELSESEKQKFVGELSAILEFVKKLNEVKTDIESLSYTAAHHTVMRPDTQQDTDLEGSSVELLAAVPEKKDSWVKVKPVF
ncbi:MAG: Asp-tRNA(Asn)/Glu-tRNA(Gln) amidotransferase subunit GatC [Candidatus Sungiibacteriota bacterium]|uniref:Aspartyl/glutamyl-tRNA(Asn/Gln) amidotransferase subunit C n=1 Tax=Candidatus Sungiibacteriota bacterium TaxID=2750080 RepID=A0A7T5RKB4_9BACT|nr:MAG: Asp-tRNA(Asn)/Glu-tRNA(Gln) amidotransferase subunit GatC [Candidatus Sungbacteria bacterium]